MITKKIQNSIERKEYDILKLLNSVFQDSLNDFNTQLSNTLKYLHYITLPIIMASLEGKSYNPFANIIEKYISFIVNTKMIGNGYKMLPLGYSSDLCFENEDHIINIDIKTANLNNPADFNKEIALGFNQTSYPASLPSGINKSESYVKDGISAIKVFSNLPSEYIIDDKRKLNLTNGLLFIYPDYKEIIDSIKKKYEEIESLIDDKLIYLYKESISDDSIIKKFLNYKPSKAKYERKKILIDNLIRGIFIHNREDLEFSEDEMKKIKSFSERIYDIAKLLINREIKPIAIVSVSVPNGFLVPHYNDEIVSGKDYGYSIRYHYGEGVYKLLDEKKSRVIFIDYNKDYLHDLKKYFNKIIKFEIIEKEQ